MLVCEHVFVRMHVQLNIKRKIRKYVCYILKGMVNGNDQSAHTRIPANGGLFKSSAHIIIQIHCHILLWASLFPDYLFENTDFHNTIVFSSKIRMYNYFLLRDVIFLLKKTLPRFTICIENMKHSFSQSCMRHKPRTASAVHSCFSFL